MIFTLNDIQIQPAKGEDHEHIFSSYCTSFPADERRDEEQFYKLLENRHCKILSISKEKISLDTLSYGSFQSLHL